MSPTKKLRHPFEKKFDAKRFQLQYQSFLFDFFYLFQLKKSLKYLFFFTFDHVCFRHGQQRTARLVNGGEGMDLMYSLQQLEVLDTRCQNTNQKRVSCSGKHFWPIITNEVKIGRMGLSMQPTSDFSLLIGVKKGIVSETEI